MNVTCCPGPYIFRHTYCAARLQTLDGDVPVSPYTVGKGLGHSGDALVRRVYAHLGTVRARTTVVEYPTERVTLKTGRRMFDTRNSSVAVVTATGAERKIA